MYVWELTVNGQEPTETHRCGIFSSLRKAMDYFANHEESVLRGDTFTSRSAKINDEENRLSSPDWQKVTEHPREFDGVYAPRCTYEPFILAEQEEPDLDLLECPLSYGSICIQRIKIDPD
jgi:hypothetical protein